MELGYACINTELGKKKILGGRTCRKARFQQEGLQYVGQLALANLTDILTILKWNEANNIRLYRMPSDIFPWMSEYEFTDLPQYRGISNKALEIGQYATKHGHRLTFHPGPFNILASKKPDVVRRTIKELRQHSEIFNMMGFEPSYYNKINIHIGAAYKDKMAVLREWCENYDLLPEHTKKRLTIENDDKPGLFTTHDLYHHVHKLVGIPIVFDYHHHLCNSGDLNTSEALSLAIKTWPAGTKPVVHYSSGRQIEDPKARKQAHADYVYEKIDLYGYDLDVVLEVKQKEKALLAYRKKFLILD
jgi:UV DNA damage endonuclease